MLVEGPYMLVGNVGRQGAGWEHLAAALRRIEPSVIN